MNATLEKATKTKKYFVKDESLHGLDNDQFNYRDIAYVLDEVIATNTPPYNIAIIGKWGLGKSSLINLVTENTKGITSITRFKKLMHGSMKKSLCVKFS